MPRTTKDNEASTTATKAEAVTTELHPLWGLLVGVLSVVLWVLAIPPFEFAEAAYVAFVPVLLWLYFKPRWRAFWLVAIGTGWIGWFAILIWLRHVTFFGTVGLAGILGALFALWLLSARWLLPRLAQYSFGVRSLGFAGLAGAWVLIEWSRTWLLWGFPWAPISLSQWERPVVLQIAAWTGAYGVSFLLILFNLAVAHTLYRRIAQEGRKLWTGWFSVDLYLAMAMLAYCIGIFFRVLPAPDSAQPLLTAGVVQPYISAELKWDDDRQLENLEILERQTRFVASLDNEVILWPEAATPWPIMGVPQMEERAVALVREIGKPILMGNLARDREADLWYNGAFLVDPERGLSADYYVKRELVPFGEFVPSYLRFIEKVVPVGGDFTPGQDAGIMELKLGDRIVRIGSLVCYEDVFPHLARESAAAGAEVFFVATNNAWYGEEGGAVQHAAHSALRAVENRRPVMRAGNGGWSGWFDAYGTLREVLLDEGGSIYFRGGGSYTVYQYEDWIRQQSFYTRHGDWFVWVSGALALLAGWIGRRTGLKQVHSVELK